MEKTPEEKFENIKKWVSEQGSFPDRDPNPGEILVKRRSQCIDVWIGPNPADRVVLNIVEPLVPYNYAEVNAIYAILGLEARDAVAKADEKVKFWMDCFDAGVNAEMILRESLQAERAKSAKWESRAWKLLGIARDNDTYAFAMDCQVGDLESDLQDEKARCAKLVEAMEDAILDLSEPLRHSNKIGLFENIAMKLQSAIEAYKNGGATNV